jgi:hypothetical protein
MPGELSDQPSIDKQLNAIPFAEFLEATPPSQKALIADLTERVSIRPFGPMDALRMPEIQIHCPSDCCGGPRFYRCATQDRYPVDDKPSSFLYLTYVCSNCRKSQKTFALMAIRRADTSEGDCTKLGEMPPYGPPTPARLISLLGPDRETFLKGRRCENQGLGIGAFAYYRRVVENQKNRILGEILRVARKLEAGSEAITALEKAVAESQFSRAMDTAKDAIPQSLLLNGHNPLKALHSALSSGVHEQSDEACLEVATSVRVVLAELSERLSQALKDEAELNGALRLLMGTKRGPNPK